jgi:hypothetical protein
MPFVDHRDLIERLTGETTTRIAYADRGRFDIRNHEDVLVEVFGDVCFVSNNDLVWSMLENSSHDVRHLHASLGSPDLFVAFCHYDSGGSYGYAIVEHGIRTRTRLQTTGIPGVPPLVENGVPKSFESPWLSASFYFEDEEDLLQDHVKVFYQGEREVLVPEHMLTSHMLNECLTSFFGVCPWTTTLVPEERFFRCVPKDVGRISEA